MKRNEEKVVEIDFEGEGLAPVSLEAVESGAIIIVPPPKDNKEETMKILIVDDDENVRDLFGILFEQMGYQVVLADNGEKGIMMVDCEFDLVLTDRQMPRMLGEEVVRKVKQKYPAMKVILMSGDLDPQVAEVAIAAGADLVIEKSPTLPSAVHAFLRGK